MSTFYIFNLLSNFKSDFSAVTMNVLNKNNLVYIADLMRLDELDIQRLADINPGSAEEILNFKRKNLKDMKPELSKPIKLTGFKNRNY